MYELYTSLSSGDKPVCIVLMEFGNEHDTTNGLWRIAAWNGEVTDFPVSGDMTWGGW